MDSYAKLCHTPWRDQDRVQLVLEWVQDRYFPRIYREIAIKEVTLIDKV